MKDLELWDGRPVGDVAVFNLNRPMNMAEFDRMPADLQHEYLFDLRTKHGARVREIAAMLGCETETVRDRLKSERIHYIDKGRKSKADQEAWEAFVAGYTFPERTGEAAQGEPIATAPAGPRNDGDVGAEEGGGPSKAPAPTGAEDGRLVAGATEDMAAVVSGHYGEKEERSGDRSLRGGAEARDGAEDENNNSGLEGFKVYDFNYEKGLSVSEAQTRPAGMLKDIATATPVRNKPNPEVRKLMDELEEEAQGMPLPGILGEAHCVLNEANDIMDRLMKQLFADEPELYEAPTVKCIFDDARSVLKESIRLREKAKRILAAMGG